MCHQPKISQSWPFTPSLRAHSFYHCSNGNNPPPPISVVLHYLVMPTSWLLAQPILTDFHYSEAGWQKYCFYFLQKQKLQTMSPRC